MRCAGKAGVVTAHREGSDATSSSMIQQYFDGTDDLVAACVEMEAAYPGKRIVHPLEIAAAVVFLGTDESSVANGTPILVDGGLEAKIY